MSNKCAYHHHHHHFISLAVMDSIFIAAWTAILQVVRDTFLLRRGGRSASIPAIRQKDCPFCAHYTKHLPTNVSHPHMAKWSIKTPCGGEARYSQVVASCCCFFVYIPTSFQTLWLTARADVGSDRNESGGGGRNI